MARFSAADGELGPGGGWSALRQRSLTAENGFADQAEVLIEDAAGCYRLVPLPWIARNGWLRIGQASCVLYPDQQQNA
ncbi:MAG: hypothetical protein R3E95_18310 [Thiolinea sp.]